MIWHAPAIDPSWTAESRPVSIELRMTMLRDANLDCIVYIAPDTVS